VGTLSDRRLPAGRRLSGFRSPPRERPCCPLHCEWPGGE
jgi:hypothetical protein